jgi:multiple sugar transport system permease protein
VAAARVGAERATTRRGRPRGGIRRAPRWLVGYALVAPNLALFAVFMFLPLVLTFVQSLEESSGFGPSAFVGLDNYTRLLGDPTFWRSFANTFGYAVICVPLELAGGLALALLINRPMRGRGLFRSVFFVPTVIAAVAAGVIAWWMFDENNGIVNKVLGVVGLHPAWQSSPFWAWSSVILLTLWTTLGFNMVVYLAGLQNIPREYYDASAVDGASAAQQLRHITVPGLRTATFFLTVYGIIGSFQVFDLIYVLTRGGPGDATNVLGLYAYQSAFETRQRGYGATIGVVLYLLLMAVTVLQWRLEKRREA